MMNKTQKDIKPILDEAKERLQRIYGERLKGLILYGIGEWKYPVVVLWSEICSTRCPTRESRIRKA